MAGGRVVTEGRDLGSAFAISTRLALTAAHVVPDRSSGPLSYAELGAAPIRVTSVRRADGLDAAVLELETDALTVLGIADVAEGARWRADTQRFGNDPVLTGTVAARRHSIDTFRHGRTDVVQLDVAQLLGDFRGYSGCAVTDDEGHAVGLLTEQLPVRGHQAGATATNVLYAVPLLDVVSALDLPLEPNRHRPVSPLAGVARSRPVARPAAQPWAPSRRPIPYQTGRVLEDVTFSADGRRLALVGGGDTMIWDVETDDLLCRLPHVRDVRRCAFVPGGSRIFTADDSFVRLWGLDGRPEEIQAWSMDAAVWELAVAPSAAYVAVAVLAGTSCVIDIKDGQVMELPAAHHQLSVAFDASGDELAAGSSLGHTWTWQVRDGALGRESRFTEGVSVTRVAFSPGGTWLTSTVKDGRRTASGESETAVVRDVLAGRLLGRLPEGQGISALTVSPDDRYLASGGFRRITLWELGTDTEPVIIDTAHLTTDLSFSPDSTTLATAVWEEPARLLDLTGSGEAYELSHGAPVRRARFSSRGQLATATADDVRIWEKSS